jgi:hypothetical protein
MQKLFNTGLVVLGLAMSTLGATNNASVRLACFSVRLLPASASQLGLSYTMEFTTGQSADATPNNELAVVSDPSLPDHGSLYRFYDPSFPDPLVGEFYLNTPPFSDQNQDGFGDFFEPSQGVTNETTSGVIYDFTGSEGQVTALWNRSANSRVGTCRITLNTAWAANLSFTHRFELLEFTGSLAYTIAGTNANGFLQLAETDYHNNTVAGAVSLIRTNTDFLLLSAGAWSNALEQSFGYLADAGLGRQGTNYLEFVQFANSNPSDGGNDYLYWVMLIGDANDANGNGIPDLSDPEVARRQPVLALSLAGDQLRLRVSGDLAVAYDLQQIGALTQTNWTIFRSLSLTQDPQVVTLPLPATGAGYWRLRGQ